MVQMDIDVHTPTPRSLRHRSAKRARSPDSMSTVDTRPSKRTSLAGDLFVPYHIPSLDLDARMGLGRPLSDTNSVGSSRPSSADDWIVQTKGLSIDSPYLGTFDRLGEKGSVHLLEKDEDMVVDPSVEGIVCREQAIATGLQLDSSGIQMDQGPRLVLPPAHQGIDSPSITMPQSTAAYTPSQAPTAAMESSPEGSSFPSSIDSAIYANIIPTIYLEHQDMQTHISRASSLPAVVGAGMPTSRRPRFTMGPRSDCEKCRLGVKGHAVHLD